jgi:hypothetical protein
MWCEVGRTGEGEVRVLGIGALAGENRAGHTSGAGTGWWGTLGDIASSGAFNVGQGRQGECLEGPTHLCQCGPSVGGEGKACQGICHNLGLNSAGHFQIFMFS